MKMRVCTCVHVRDNVSEGGQSFFNASLLYQNDNSPNSDRRLRVKATSKYPFPTPTIKNKLAREHPFNSSKLNGCSLNHQTETDWGSYIGQVKIIPQSCLMLLFAFFATTIPCIVYLTQNGQPCWKQHDAVLIFHIDYFSLAAINTMESDWIPMAWIYQHTCRV